jgi:hypothetical protein
VVVDFTGLPDVVFTGFGGLLVVLTDTGFTFVDDGATGLETDVCVGFGGFTDLGFGPPWVPRIGVDVSNNAQITVSTRRFITPPR